VPERIWSLAVIGFAPRAITYPSRHTVEVLVSNGLELVSVADRFGHPFVNQQLVVVDTYRLPA
jgi:hypothetical protein